MSTSARSRSVSRSPKHSSSPHVSHRQMGRGVPQYRSREMAQSTLLRNHSPNLPCWMCSGCQLMSPLSATISSLYSVVRMYQEGLA